MSPPAIARIHAHYQSSPVIPAIAPDDVMWKTGKDWYFPVGQSAIHCILAALQLSRLETVASILDLPCGHGRVARHLRAAFPVAELAYCDLDAAAAAFCAATFGGRAIPSLPELASLELGGSFDLIWVGSLFTHVDRPRTQRWLEFLCRHLNPNGVLLATFHGIWAREVHLRHYPMIGPPQWAAIEDQFACTGFGYAPHPGQDFGISLCHPSTVMDICTAIPSIRILSYTERGWAEHHDVVALARTDRLQDWQSAACR